MKKKVIIIFLILTALPFVLIKTVYPFFRFGMFAEPVGKNMKVDKEELSIRYQKDGEWHVFKGTEIGLSESVFAQMVRQEYYKKNQQEFLLKLKRTCPQSVEKWEFLNAGIDTVKSK